MRKRLSVSERRTAAPFWLGDLGFRTFWCAIQNVLVRDEDFFQVFEEKE